MECLNQKLKEKASKKKYGKNKKQRRAYIAWEDNDTSSSSSSDKEEKANLCMMAGHELDSNGLWIARKQLWYLDSSCSKHMTGDEGFVTYGDNNKGKILGRGDVGRHDSIIIKDVLLVDGLKHNLLSISKLCDKSYEVTFKPDLCLISHASARQTLLIGKRVNNIYMLNICDIGSSMTYLLSKNDDSWLWHRRLAHIHMHHLDRLVSKNLVEGLPTLKYEKDIICEACQKGKQTKNVFKTKKFVSATHPLELLHMDLFGPSRTMNVGGNYYGLVIVGDFSRFTWTLFIVSKDHAFIAFKHLAKVLENENNCHISLIKSDYGGEFENERFENFCSKHGIKHNFSA